jgi:sulfate adenylyltransferase
MTRPGDVDYFTRVRCYQLLVSKYPRGHGQAGFIAISHADGRTAGSDLARDHSKKSRLLAFHRRAAITRGQATMPMASHSTGPYEAQELFRKHEAEIGVEMVPFQMMVYVEDRDKYFPENEVPAGSRVLNLSGTQLRRRLNDGREIPAWFTFPEIAQNCGVPSRRGTNKG